MFMFKKIIGSLIMPLPLALLFIASGLVIFWWTSVKKDQAGNKKGAGGQVKYAGILVFSGFLIILLASNGPVSRWLIAPLEHTHPPYAQQSVNAVLVLGSHHHSAPGFPVTSYLENDGLYRLAEGIRIALLHDDIPLLVSGFAFKDPISQAEAYRQVAVALGFPEERIILLASGRDTFEEMQSVSKIIGSKPLALVTSAYHMPRSMAAAKRNSLQAVAAPTWHNAKPSHNSAFDFWVFLPSTKALMLSTRALHEYFGLLWYRITDRL